MTDAMLARLQREHAGRWDTWTVPQTHQPTAWCTKPAGAPACVHEETSGERMQAWLAQVTALQDKGVTLQFGPARLDHHRHRHLDHPRRHPRQLRRNRTQQPGDITTPASPARPRSHAGKPPPPPRTPGGTPMIAIPQATITEWETEGNHTQQVAARLTRWAAGKPPRTIVPADDVITAMFPKVTTRPGGYPAATTAAVIHRAVKLLTNQGILYRDHDTGHYHTAATEAAAAPAPPQPPATQAT
jgi:hypothetical protein